MALPRYHTCASLPTCRIYVHPFRNSFGLIELCRLSQDTRLTSDSCSSGWSFVIGFLHQGRCLPRLARFTRPSPVRADSGLSPHRHTCAAGRTKEKGPLRHGGGGALRGGGRRRRRGCLRQCAGAKMAPVRMPRTVPRAVADQTKSASSVSPLATRGRTSSARSSDTR